MTDQVSSAVPQAPSRLLWQLVLGLTAIGAVLLAMLFVAWWVGPFSRPPPRNPFGMGLREPVPTGSIGAAILSVQAAFSRNLQAAVSAWKQGSGAFDSLVLLGFAYGVFHAAGPGHGKAVISAYIVAEERALRKAVVLSFGAALVQALAAIGLVVGLSLLMRATAASMNRLTVQVETASFVLLALIGLWMTWRKAGTLIGTMVLARNPQAGAQDQACDHAHLPPPEVVARLRSWPDMVAISISAGLRPCAGALIVLVFSLAQGVFAAGIAATLAMSLGTALTTSVIAALAVLAKSVALRLAGGRGATGALLVSGLELVAAAVVAALGATLLLGTL
jgi:ABC-type nickel/cobalt efflux system permease component RcnA